MSFRGNRRWSRAEKERIVATMEPGAVASEIARAAGIHTSQLFRWRQQLCEGAHLPAAFKPVAIAAEAGLAASAERPGVIEMEFAAGGRMRIAGPVDGSTVSALIKALAKSKRRR